LKSLFHTIVFVSH